MVTAGGVAGASEALGHIRTERPELTRCGALTEGRGRPPGDMNSAPRRLDPLPESPYLQVRTASMRRGGNTAAGVGGASLPRSALEPTGYGDCIAQGGSECLTGSVIPPHRHTAALAGLQPPSCGRGRGRGGHDRWGGAGGTGC